MSTYIRTWCLCAAGMAVACFGMGQQIESSVPINVLPAPREDLMAELAADVPMKDFSIVSSSDGERIAWLERRGKRWRVMLNGTPVGSEYDEVANLQFGPDSRRLSFAARNAKDWRNVIDGKEQGGPYREVGRIRFNSDGSRSAFRAKDTDGWHCVMDAKVGPAYKEVSTISFSPTGEHFAYAAQKGKQYVIVADGKEGSAYDYAGPPLYREKDSAPTFVARRKDTWILADKEKEEQLGEAKDGYRFVGFTPDTEEATLYALDGENSRILLGKRQGSLRDAIVRPVFSKDYRHFVYATARIKNPAIASERAFGQVVIDGQGGREYEGAPVESTGKAWLRATTEGAILQLQRGTVEEFTARRYGVSSPTMSEDGQHVAYAARRGKDDFTVILDGQEGRRVTIVACHDITSVRPAFFSYYIPA
jgi:hypothetical protein